MMKMELDFETVLDVALGGPEIGPLNLYVLHGLMKEVFAKFALSEKTLIVEENDPNFCDAYKFIKSKVDEQRPRTAGGGYSRDRSKISVIVADYARSPIGKTYVEDEKKKPSLLPADVEDRLRFIESELKIVKDFPSVNELRNWAQEKTSPDTVVTDLWHFVSLNHRMGGAEEGIGKLTELVDKLIPELKKLQDGQETLQGQIDDLYSQMKGVTDRTSRIDERLDSAGTKAEGKVKEISEELKDMEDRLQGYAKLTDLEDFVLADTFVLEKDKARAVAEDLKKELNSKASLNDLPDEGQVFRVYDEVNNLKNLMEHVAFKEDLPDFESYVKWLQLEDALLTSNSRPSSRSSRPGSKYGNRQISFSEDQFRPNSRNSVPDSRRGSELNIDEFQSEDGRNSQPGSQHNQRGSPAEYQKNGSQSSSRSGSRSNSHRNFNGHHGSSPPDNGRNSPNKKYPSEACLQKLREMGLLAERQKALMDALDATREQLAKKADKSDLDGFVTQDDLKDLLNFLRDLREEVKGLQSWRNIVNEEKGPALRDVLGQLEQQVADLLNRLAHLMDEEKRKQKSLDSLFTYVDRLEENKLNKDDELLNRLKTETGEIDLDKYSSKEEVQDVIDKLAELAENLANRLNEQDDRYKKKLAEMMNDMDEKLDRSELQPLREYLENRYDVLTQQQQEQLDQEREGRDENDHCGAHEKVKKKPKNGQTPPRHTFNISHTMTQDVPPHANGYGKTTSTPIHHPSKGMPSYNGYVMEDVDCSHPHYGESGFVPKKKEAAAFRTQMKFNCLSCDRPLTMHSNSHLQTVRGRPLNAYELDQLKVLQKILKGDRTGKPVRACGGSHTSSTPTRRITARINSGKSLPVMPREEANQPQISNGEVDIEGLDGRLYRGLINKQDLTGHSRSKSANAQIRTVSPRPKSGHERPISGKSVDFTSSMSSGLGTTHGSFNIQIEE